MMTDEWDVYRAESKGYHPRTQNAALRSLMGGFIKPEEFIMKMLSLQPLNVEPWDLAEIDRVLARKDLEIETILVLIPVLQGIMHQHDRERALSAAESLGNIEKRYLSRIENLRRSLDILESGPDRREALRRLVQDLYEFSLINAPLGTLKNYYLKEAMEVSLRYEKECQLEVRDWLARIQLLEGLGLHLQVQALLEKPGLREVLGPVPFARLQAANAFNRKEFAELTRIMETGPDMYTDDLSRFWGIREDRTHEDA